MEETRGMESLGRGLRIRDERFPGKRENNENNENNEEITRKRRGCMVWILLSNRTVPSSISLRDILTWCLLLWPRVDQSFVSKFGWHKLKRARCIYKYMHLCVCSCVHLSVSVFFVASPTRLRITTDVGMYTSTWLSVSARDNDNGDNDDCGGSGRWQWWWW